MPSQGRDPLSRESSKNTETRVHDANFRQKFIDRYIYDSDFYDESYDICAVPQNLDELKQVVAEPLKIPSGTPITKKSYKDFLRKCNAAMSGNKWMQTAYADIAGILDTTSHEADVLLNNFRLVIDNELATPKPDSFDYAKTQHLDKEVCDSLEEYVYPTKHLHCGVVLNYFFEAKGKGGTQEASTLQACHDGVLGSRAIHRLREDNKNNAYAITATWAGSTLVPHAHHTTPNKIYDKSAAYYMTVLKGWYLRNNFEDHREAVIALRNLEFWAKQRRDDFIEQENQASRALSLSIG